MLFLLQGLMHGVDKATSGGWGARFVGTNLQGGIWFEIPM
jgi:hypothetical protein